MAFDVFGAVVDWRSSMARATAPVLAATGRGFVKFDMLNRDVQTALVRPPFKFGGAPAPDLAFAADWNVHADSLVDLADKLGC